MRYAYRRLDVGWEDERVGPGPPPARCRIHDSGGGATELTRAEDEDPEAFARRRRDAVTDCLNRLGREGWRLLSYAPAVLRSPTGGETHIAPWPVGTHLLAREEPDEPSSAGGG